MAEPIDLQNVLSKTQAAEKVAKLEKARPEIAQKQAAAEFHEKVDNKQKKVHDSNQTDEVIIHREEKKKENGKGEKKKKRADSSSQEEERTDYTGEDVDVIDDHIDFLA